MSLALFRQTLRSAVLEAQDDNAATDAPRGPAPQTALRLLSTADLRRIARGEISIEEALANLERRHG
ncbi:MAG TPA: hypothetical protein VMU37_05390 [Caulobacteraceae bacterium]|nr:hypothetical protein [Caulobacteraceae bacterium]